MREVLIQSLHFFERALGGDFALGHEHHGVREPHGGQPRRSMWGVWLVLVAPAESCPGAIAKYTSVVTC